ncbi:MAG: hypothetical protein ACOCTU_00825 [Bacteroidota bacterium]
MKNLFFLIILALFLFACQAEKESRSVRYPEPPNKPPRVPSGPAVIVDQAMPLPPDKDDGNKKGRKEDDSNKKPTRDSVKEKGKDRDNDRNRR